jgi:2-polyprenyl-3-methyl-5-hydroxy-6-metoxy-1,4-benzoquinol methylase
LDSIYGPDPLSDLRVRKLSSVMQIEGSNFLDIGFGIPYFLYHLKKLGGNVYGLEQVDQAIAYAKQSGLENVYSQFSDLPENVKFDAIPMNDLVEHPLDPMGLLSASYERLSPGGKILIWTPNGNYSKTDTEATSFRVDLEHMQYFTTKGIAYLASKLGAHIEHLECYGFPVLSDLVLPQSSNQKTTLRLKKYLKNFYPVIKLSDYI